MNGTQFVSTHPSSRLGATRLRSHNLALRRALQGVPNVLGAMLEVGCGVGRFIRTIGSARPGLSRHGLDISPWRIKYAQKEDRWGNYLVGSAANLPYTQNSFDLVLLMDVLEHLPNPAQALSEVRRVLQPGGTLHALVPCEGQPATLHWLLWKMHLGADLKQRHEGHLQRFTHRQLIALCQQSGLQIRDITYSMHLLGQIRDVLSYLQREKWAPKWLFSNPLYRLFDTVLWLLAYVESILLARMRHLAVAAHVTANKPIAEVSS